MNERTPKALGLSSFYIKQYKYDERLKWDTWIVMTTDGEAVLGFADGPL